METTTEFALRETTERTGTSAKSDSIDTETVSAENVTRNITGDKETLEEGAGISTGAVVASSVASVAAVGGAAGAATHVFRGKPACGELPDVDFRTPKRKARSSKSGSAISVNIPDEPSNFELDNQPSGYSMV